MTIALNLWHMCRQPGVFGCSYYSATDILAHVGVFTTMPLTDINTCAGRQICLCVFTTMPLTDIDTCAGRQICLGVFTTMPLTDIDTWSGRQICLCVFTTMPLTDIDTCAGRQICLGVFTTMPLTYWHKCRQTGVCFFGVFYNNSTDRFWHMWVFFRQCHWTIDTCVDRRLWVFLRQCDWHTAVARKRPRSFYQKRR